MPKELGNSKGIMENPILKIEITKTKTFKVSTFGEYLDVKRKGRTPIVAKSKKEVPKKKKVKTIGLDDKMKKMKKPKKVMQLMMKKNMKKTKKKMEKRENWKKKHEDA
jgi:hypothetical protein